MKKDAYLCQTLCLMFCSYYKPGKNEELVCRGYAVVDRMRQRGRSVSFKKSKKRAAPATVEDLRKALCAVCDFHEHDCDFFQDRAAPSCGGFALLAQLLESGDIALQDIK
jgi:hypothetical protein